MPASTLLWLFGVMLAGVALLVWGFRGKRLNTHPVCRQCRFDLSGQPEGTVTCPECGAGLKREGSIRIGQRRKRPVVLLLGGLAVALPLLAIGTIVFALVTGTDLNGYKPLGVLNWEARRADAARAKLIGAELLKRIQVKGIAQDQYDRIVQIALEHQGDIKRTWATEWGDIVERADTDGKLTKEDKSRYRRQAIVLSFESRPTVRLGDELPVIAKVSEARTGSAAMILSMVQLEAASVDGKPAKRGKVAIPGSFEGGFDFTVANMAPQIGMFYIYGARSAFGVPSEQGKASLTLTLPEGLQPGRHQSKVALSIMTIDQPTSTFTWPNQHAKDNPDVRLHEAALVFDVRPKEAEGVALVAPTVDQTKKLESLLEPTGCMTFGQSTAFGQPQQVMMNFQTEGRPIDFAFDVVIKVGEKEWRASSLSSGNQATSEQGTWGPGGQKSRTVMAMVRGFKAGKADVILRPSEKVALQTTDLTSIYGKEIVFKDVEFNDQQDMYSTPASPGSSSFLGDIIRGLFGK